MVGYFKELENLFAEYIGTKHAVSVNTGTAGLHLALVGLGVGKGDEVIVPDFTMAACGFAVSYTGATPVFVPWRDDLNIDEEKIEEYITPKTKVIMAVHIYGRVCNMGKIMEIAEKYNLRVIEDCSEAHGAEWNGKKVGSYDVGVFSLYKNKIVHAEEGGIITTNDTELTERLNNLKSMAFGKDHNYFHKEIGFNYRMTDSQAKLAIKSLKEINKELLNREKIALIYSEKIKRIPSEVVWVYDFPTEKNYDHLFEYGVRQWFKPLSTFPMYGGATKDYPKGYYFPVNISPEEAEKLCQLI